MYDQWKWVDSYGRALSTISGLTAFIPGKPDKYATSFPIGTCVTLISVVKLLMQAGSVSLDYIRALRLYASIAYRNTISDCVGLK